MLDKVRLDLYFIDWLEIRNAGFVLCQLVSDSVISKV